MASALRGILVTALEKSDNLPSEIIQLQEVAASLSADRFIEAFVESSWQSVLQLYIGASHDQADHNNK
jgi:hypothetical protein